MKSSGLQALGFPSNIEQLIEETEGVELIEETPAHFEICDSYGDVDRELRINKSPVLTEDMVELFGRSDLSFEEIRDFLAGLPPLLLMHLRKIFFVKEEKDIEVLEEETPNHTFAFNERTIGMAVYCDSTVILNLANLEACAEKDEKEDLRVLGYSDGKEALYKRAVFQTLAHELFHLAQFNPLIEEHIPDGEDEAEEFCRDISGD